MSYVVSLDGIIPPKRLDDKPWNRAIVSESLVETGPFVQIFDSGVFPDLDVDPTNPRERGWSVTSQNAASWLQVTFKDQDGNSQPLDPIFSGETLRPSVQEVADLLLTRARTQGGAYVGTFNASTTPTASQVERLITKATDRVVARFDGQVLGENDRRQVRDLAAIGAAMFVELAFFPNELDTDRSPYQELKSLWDTAMGSEATGVGGGGGEIVPTGGRQAVWTFDKPYSPLKNTEW